MPLQIVRELYIAWYLSSTKVAIQENSFLLQSFVPVQLRKTDFAGEESLKMKNHQASSILLF